MKDLITAIGLLIFIEGFLIAMFPSKIKNMVNLILKTPDIKLRIFGAFLVTLGLIIIWYIRK